MTAKLGMLILHGECYLRTKPGYSVATNKQTLVVKIKKTFNACRVHCIHALPAIPLWGIVTPILREAIHWVLHTNLQNFAKRGLQVLLWSQNWPFVVVAPVVHLRDVWCITDNHLAKSSTWLITCTVGNCWHSALCLYPFTLNYTLWPLCL